MKKGINPKLTRDGMKSDHREWGMTWKGGKIWQTRVHDLQNNCGSKKKRIHNDSITKAKLWFQSLSLSWEAELSSSLCKNVHILDFGDIDNYHQL